MRMTFTRDFYIPAGSTKVSDKNSSAVAYVYNDASGRPAAAMFAGRAAKPLKHVWYRSTAAREQRVGDFFKGVAASEQSKAARRAEQRQPHGLQVGDIMVSSWGYEQTNVDFYQITATTPHGITMRAIGQRRLEATGPDAGYCEPVRDAFKPGAEDRKFRVPADGVARIASYAHARKRDGRKCYWSAYA